MPEPYYPKRKGPPYHLSQAAKTDDLASIRCTYCKRQRYYFIADLITAFGNVECDDLIRVAKLRCRRCDGKGSLELHMCGPPSNIADKAWLRRIDHVENVRRIHWKDVQGV
jgi:hypothetical protein